MIITQTNEMDIFKLDNIHHILILWASPENKQNYEDSKGYKHKKQHYPLFQRRGKSALPCQVFTQFTPVKIRLEEVQVFVTIQLNINSNS